MIEGFIGLIGAGKTMLAVQHAGDLARRSGSVLASNIKVVMPDVTCVQLGTGEDGFDIGEVWRVIDEAKGAGRGVVWLVDEVGILMPARFWQSMPIDLMFSLSQSRKLALDVVYTAQDIEQVDSFLRRLTQWIYKVRAYPSPSTARRRDGKRPWVFHVTQWRPATVDKKDRREGRRFIRYRREWEAAYDTDELVRPPARLADKGRRGTKGAGGVVVTAEAEVVPLRFVGPPLVSPLLPVELVGGPVAPEGAYANASANKAGEVLTRVAVLAGLLRSTRQGSAILAGTATGLVSLLALTIGGRLFG
jgi:hypothetical protein